MGASVGRIGSAVEDDSGVVEGVAIVAVAGGVSVDVGNEVCSGEGVWLAVGCGVSVLRGASGGVGVFVCNRGLLVGWVATVTTEMGLC